MCSWRGNLTTASSLPQNTDLYLPCAWPPKSNVVKVIPAIVSSSEAVRQTRGWYKLLPNYIAAVLLVVSKNQLWWWCWLTERQTALVFGWAVTWMTDSHLLGCKVGTCCPNLSSLSICSSVVFPALSRPRNTNLPDFLYSPEENNNKKKDLLLRSALLATVGKGTAVRLL